MLIVGIILFAVGIMLSIVLHEYGHMKVAQMSGMKVRRFFVGFGPTVWSTHRGGIEYGLKAVPLGGFCDIAGMTAYDQLSAEDEPRAMWRQAWWKRVAVLLANGLNAEQIAAERNASLLTVRTQIRSILAKTGVRRQPELVRMLVDMPEVGESARPG